MRRYYTIWQRNTVSMATALRDAQLAFANGAENDDWKPEWREPYYWAGFSYVPRRRRPLGARSLWTSSRKGAVFATLATKRDLRRSLMAKA